MVIGGRDDHYMVNGPGNFTHNVKLVSQAEIFGCPGGVNPPISRFPNPVSGHAAAAAIDGTALVCGGATSTNGSRYSSFTNECKKFNVNANTWEDVAPMLARRTGHFLASIDMGDGAKPTVMGGRNVTEDGWMDYQTDYSVDQLSNGVWTATSKTIEPMYTSCLTMVDNQIYQISSRWGTNETVKIDARSWVNETVAGAPHWTPIYCMPHVMDGSPGIFSSRGNWFNISSSEWSRNDHNYSQITGAGVASLNGSPVKLGGWLCKFEGQMLGSCDVSADVLQYNETSGGWDMIGQLEQARTYPVAVTLPASVCNVPPPPPDSVIMVIGGRDDHYRKFNTSDPDSVVHNVSLISHVEVFGCPDDTLISSFPTPISGHASATVIDGTAMVCGGSTATNGSRYVSFTDKCHKLNTATNTWEEMEPMSKLRLSPYLTNLDMGNGIAPTMMGGYNTTEDGWRGEYDYSVKQLLNGAWTETAKMLPDMRINCMTVVDNQLYTISSKWSANETIKINPLTWSNESVAIAPHWTPIYCIPYTMDGTPGIFSTRGNWLNITSGEWSENKHNYSQITGAGVGSLKGTPVKVGGWVCNFTTDGYLAWCDVSGEIMQYNHSSGEWDLIGELQQARTFPTVLTLPGSICDIPPPPPPPPTTTTSTSAPTTTMIPPTDKDTVVMVIGGRDDHYRKFNESDPDSVVHNVSMISHVEVFGCPDDTPISSFPTPISGHASTTVVDGTAMVCGGSTATNGSRYVSFTDKCHKLNTATNTWEEMEPMSKLRLSPYLTNLDMGNGMAPTMMGGYNTTEDGWRGEYDYSVEQLLNGAWTETAKMLPDMRINCMTVVDDQLYTISSKWSANETIKINPLTWSNESVAIAPYWTPIYCIPYTIDGTPGIFSTRGNWLNITNGEWSENKHNYSQITGAGVGSLKGNPVKVGGWVCDFTTEGYLSRCDVSGEIMQYNHSSGEWDLIGQLQQARTFPTVLTLPRSICDIPPPTTTPAPTSEPTTMIPPPNEDTVVMVLGGRDDYYQVINGDIKHNVSLIPHVEIFGCPESTSISPYPTPISGHATGTTINGSAMICGGATATYNTGYRNFTNACHTYDSQTDQWIEVDGTKSFRSQPYMFELDMGNGKLPTIMGGYNVSEDIGLRLSYDYSIEQLLNGVWTTSSNKLPEIQIRCMTVVNDKLYPISSRYYENITLEIDPTSWTNQTIASAPLYTPTYCVPYTMNGQKGIFTSRGNFLNLDSGEWSRNGENYHYYTGAGVGSLRGHPVKVGGWKCTFNGTMLDNCDVSGDVMQYNQTSEGWDLIGQLEQARSFPVVVTLPASVCRAPITPTAEPSPPTAEPSPSTGSTSETPTTTASATIAKFNATILVLLAIIYIFS